jgi:spermidine synthase
VLDYPHYNNDLKQDGETRWLFVNRISQTKYDPLADESKNEEKYFSYVYHISDFTDSIPGNARILILGLGGGSIANRLTEKGFSVDVCELDRRIVEVAKKYFNLSEKVNVTVDDARHYIKTCTKKYDLIIFDTFKGEDPPNHVFTTESLEETKKLTNPDAIIIVNSMGYLHGNKGKATRSIYKTFMSSGFDVEVLSTDPNPDQSNLLYFASLKKLKKDKRYIPRNRIDLKDAMVLKDEYPRLDILNAAAAKQWRAMTISSFNSSMDQKVIPVFK